MTLLDAAPAIAAAPPLDVRTVLVPIDGADTADRVVAPASWLAQRLGADVEVVVAADRMHWAERSEWLARLPVGAPVAARHVIVDDEPTDAITAAIGFGDRVLGCLATKARRPAPWLDSVASSVVEQATGPVVLVGPRARAPRRHGPVVVAVDGHRGDVDLIVEAARWSVALGTTLLVVTVAEPALASPDGHTRRARGPEDPEAYLAALQASSPTASVRTDAVYDPISVEDGLLPLLDRLAPSLVIAGHRHHGHLHRMLLGDHTTSITRLAPVPVLAVPLGLRR